MIIQIKRLGTVYDVLVSEEDYSYLSQFKWYIHKSGYAVRNRSRNDLSGTSKTIRMHREVIRLQGLLILDNFVPDHINRNKLDNTRSNLRLVSRSENSKNVSEDSKLQRLTQVEHLASLGRTEKQKFAYKSNFAIGATRPRTQKQIDNMKKIGASTEFTKRNGEHYKAKKVIDIVSNEIFSCIKEAAIKLGVDAGRLSRKLRGLTKTNDTTLRFYEEKLCKS